ncbi:hypothetical protein TNCT_674161 [Trichonephila clavata]|uniref:Uncharacterized protein n=1 Tax=Trichonephila clavata TaxID=2740835 RepID=A0A8X6GSM8_TRICU|nr:hypothetical protein TNCT_674161 [Trichonephila clavata]
MASYNSFSNPISLTLKAVYRKANILSHCQAPAYLIFNVTIQRNQGIPRVSPQWHAPTYRQQSSLSVTHISNLRHFRHVRIKSEKRKIGFHSQRALPDGMDVKACWSLFRNK